MRGLTSFHSRPNAPKGETMEFGASRATSKGGADTGSAIMARPGILTAVFFKAGASTDTCTIYDNATAALGTVLFACSGTQVAHFHPCEFFNGLWRVQTQASGTSVSVVHVVGDSGTSS